MDLGTGKVDIENNNKEVYSNRNSTTVENRLKIFIAIVILAGLLISLS